MSSFISALLATSLWIPALPSPAAIYVARAVQIFVIALLYARAKSGSISVSRPAMLFGICLLVSPIAHLTVGDATPEARVDLLRQGYAAFIVIGLSAGGGLTEDEIRRTLKLSMLIALALAIYAVLAILQSSGFSGLFDYASLKETKYALNERGLPLNALTYALTASIFVGWLWARPTQARYCIAAGTIAILAYISGSSTSFAAFVLATVSAPLLLSISSRIGARPPALLVAATPIAIVVPLVLYIATEPWLLDVINEATVGRTYMWLVALRDFDSSPVIGAGPFSWRENFFAGVTEYTSQLSSYDSVVGGAYHSIALTTAAERGTVGVLALLLATYVIFRALFARFREGAQSARGALRIQILLAINLFAVVRGIAEYSGFFAYANSLVDLLALFMVALALRARHE